MPDIYKTFKVGSVSRWGLLVKSWATGLNYLGKGPTELPYYSDKQGDVESATPLNPTQAPDEAWRLTHDVKTKKHTAPSNRKFEDRTVEMIDFSESKLKSEIPLPLALGMTRETFLAKLRAAEVPGADLPDVKYVIIVQGSSDTSIFNLPPKDMLIKAETALTTTSPYQLPAFYGHYWDNKPPRIPADVPGVLRLQTSRIGDYTMSYCG
jgi:hypothetical protein